MTPRHCFGRVWLSSSVLFATFLIASCAQYTPTRDELVIKDTSTSTTFSRQGRLSLHVDSEPPQSLSGAFLISGNAETGDLTLSTPFGGTLVKLSWTPEQASLKSNSNTSYYASANALVEQVTGTVLPLAALFDWLAGRDTPAPGWQTDLSQFSHPDSPRFMAKRTEPLPVVELRIVLDQ